MGIPSYQNREIITTGEVLTKAGSINVETYAGRGGDCLDMLPRPRYLRRYREIASVLAKNGFGYVVNRLGLVRLGNEGFPSHSDTTVRREDHSRLGERLRITFEELGPTFVKLGQLMSTRSDLFSPGIIAEMQKLQDEVKPFSFEQAKKVIESELGSSIESLFGSFCQEPLAAASIGQVYRATLPSGEEVAVKVQRPGIQETVEADLDIMFDISRLAARRLSMPGFESLPDVVEEFSRSLSDQMDYTVEGRNADRFAKNFEGEKAVQIPKVWWEYTTRKVLTLEYIEGINLKEPELLDELGISRHDVARMVASAILDQILIHGLFHADPHPSNMVAKPSIIAFLDFGMVGRVSEERRSQFTSILIGLMKGDSNSLVRSIQDIGMIPLDTDTSGLKAEIERLRETYYNCPLEEVRIANVITEYMSIAYRFRLRMPSEFTMVLRSLATVEGVVSSLDPTVSVMEIAKPIAERLVRQKFKPQHLLSEGLNILYDYIELIRDIPDHAHSVLRGLRGGQFRFKADPEELASVQKQISRVTSAISRSIVVLALSILLAGIIVGFSVRPTLTTLGSLAVHVGLIFSFALFIWLVVSIIKSH